MRPLALGGRTLQCIRTGECFAGAAGEVVRTVLGSCVAVCLRDPFTKIGGANHFMLPTGDDVSGRYGVYAMEILINACMRLGADRNRLEAKVFGGGRIFGSVDPNMKIGDRNVEFALRFLQVEGIPIVGKDLLGDDARELYFFTDDGRVFLHHVQGSLAQAKKIAETQRMEAEAARTRLIPISDDHVTLFYDNAKILDSRSHRRRQRGYAPAIEVDPVQRPRYRSGGDGQ